MFTNNFSVYDVIKYYRTVKEIFRFQAVVIWSLLQDTKLDENSSYKKLPFTCLDCLRQLLTQQPKLTYNSLSSAWPHSEAIFFPSAGVPGKSHKFREKKKQKKFLSVTSRQLIFVVTYVERYLYLFQARDENLGCERFSGLLFMLNSM